MTAGTRWHERQVRERLGEVAAVLRLGAQAGLHLSPFSCPVRARGWHHPCSRPAMASLTRSARAARERVRAVQPFDSVVVEPSRIDQQTTPERSARTGSGE